MNNLLDICLQTTSRPVKPVAVKQVMHLRNCQKTPCKNSRLDCHQPSYHHLVVLYLGVPIDLILTIDAPPVGIMRSLCRDLMLGSQRRL